MPEPWRAARGRQRPRPEPGCPHSWPGHSTGTANTKWPVALPGIPRRDSGGGAVAEVTGEAKAASGSQSGRALLALLGKHGTGGAGGQERIWHSVPPPQLSAEGRAIRPLGCGKWVGASTARRSQAPWAPGLRGSHEGASLLPPACPSPARDTATTHWPPEPCHRPAWTLQKALGWG